MKQNHSLPIESLDGQFFSGETEKPTSAVTAPKCPECGAPIETVDGKRPFCDNTLKRESAAAAEPTAESLGDAVPISAEKKKKKIDKRKLLRTSTSYLTKLAILSAMATVLLLIEFPIFPWASHLKLNISDVPALIASFMFGPISGCAVTGIKVGLGLLIRGTSTAFVGDIGNLIGGAVYCIASGLIYKIRKTKLGALLGCALGSLLFMGAMWISNQFFLLPMFGLQDPTAVMIMLWWTLLFNFIKCVLTTAITFLLYKAVRRVFKKW